MGGRKGLDMNRCKRSSFDNAIRYLEKWYERRQHHRRERLRPGHSDKDPAGPSLETD